MLKVTLDTNCIIDLERNRPAAAHIRKLIHLHSEGKINLRVVAISASERKPDDTFVSHFDEFKERLAATGLADVEILRTIHYWGISFWGHMLWSGRALSELERKIQEILFPTIELEFSDYCNNRGLDPEDVKAWRRWVNKKCDVLAMWSHIWHEGDVFVTSDLKDFHKENKKSRLITLGAKRILTPYEAVEFCACT